MEPLKKIIDVFCDSAPKINKLSCLNDVMSIFIQNKISNVLFK